MQERPRSLKGISFKDRLIFPRAICQLLIDIVFVLKQLHGLDLHDDREQRRGKFLSSAHIFLEHPLRFSLTLNCGSSPSFYIIGPSDSPALDLDVAVRSEHVVGGG